MSICGRYQLDRASMAMERTCHTGIGDEVVDRPAGSFDLLCGVGDRGKTAQVTLDSDDVHTGRTGQQLSTSLGQSDMSHSLGYIQYEKWDGSLLPAPTDEDELGGALL